MFHQLQRGHLGELFWVTRIQMRQGIIQPGKEEPAAAVVESDDTKFFWLSRRRRWARLVQTAHSGQLLFFAEGEHKINQIGQYGHGRAGQ